MDEDLQLSGLAGSSHWNRRRRTELASRRHEQQAKSCFGARVPAVLGAAHVTVLLQSLPFLFW
jgi:hypothetical protein